MDKATVDNLRELFDEVDVGHKGALDKHSLAKLLEATGTWVDDETCDFLFDIMDLQRNGKVSFEEFASVFYQQKSRKKDPMQLADQMWNLFDPKNTGVITTVTVEATLNRTFPKYDTADILRLLRHLDYENLGVVERSRFQEYVSTVFKEQGLGDGQ
jgi:Ca2+-binding EF-hand superfamily protein